MERKPIINEFDYDDEDNDQHEEAPPRKRSEFLNRWRDLISGNRPEVDQEDGKEEESEEDEEDDVPQRRRLFRRFFTSNVTL